MFVVLVMMWELRNLDEITSTAFISQGILKR